MLIIHDFWLEFKCIDDCHFYGIMMLGHRMSFSNTLAESLKVEKGELRADATAVCQTSQQLAGSVGTTIFAAIISIWQKSLI